MSGPRFVLIFYDRSIGDMTVAETPRFMTPHVSIYDLLSIMEYRLKSGLKESFKLATTLKLMLALLF